MDVKLTVGSGMISAVMLFEGWKKEEAELIWRKQALNDEKEDAKSKDQCKKIS